MEENWIKKFSCYGVSFSQGEEDLNPNFPSGTLIPGLYGQGENAWFERTMIFPWTLYDQLELPTDLEEGNYVLSFRWDTEQTPQVFNSCADIIIE